ncbi:AMP-binding protein [Tabrizicola oligotrophica]|uniref:Long-chain fatty acid--CoA ligase n=1 Tax=Tabrizicola oligotrophica TaxID=2710650 RepID=A0A6M0QXG0_9RHOB|nr:AMP-binding protein [Tabrizicola oligotrophica]NEY91474.1 long-chain fatty acid--CoA ligase [Tabrizicola oligotrophica]
MHPAARLFDAGGEASLAPGGGGLLAERPSAVALDGAFGGPFRIGGVGGLATGAEEFETLTSGSSGQPRRIVRSFASWQASFAVNAGLFGIGPGVRVAVLGRLTHSLALYGAVEAVSLGAELHLLDDLRPDRQRRALGERAVTVLYATPAQLRLLIEAGGPQLPLARVLVGGSKLDRALRAGLAAMAPDAQVQEFYGAAEASFITLSGPDCPEDSVGRPYPGVEIVVEAGEIWVRSPYLFRGYAGEDPGSARWRAGWLSVGEMGRMEGGFLYLSGRAGRMVTVADQNVFPEEIEGFLMGLPGVERAAVLPRPDALRGVHLVAVIAGTAGDADLLAACRAALGPLKAPKAVFRLAEWPMLASGKTDLAAIERAFGWR